MCKQCKAIGSRGLKPIWLQQEMIGLLWCEQGGMKHTEFVWSAFGCSVLSLSGLDWNEFMTALAMELLEFSYYGLGGLRLKGMRLEVVTA